MDMEHIIVKCNNDVLITAYVDQTDTLLTVRQMPCDAHPETDFPVTDQLNIRCFSKTNALPFSQMYGLELKLCP